MNDKAKKSTAHKKTLRRGFTTGACATAATKSALNALLFGDFLNPVQITLPKGQKPSFPLQSKKTGTGWAKAAIIKDAGDDPDVTHGATIIVKISHGEKDKGVVFCAGKGVGIITKAGLALGIGEPAINPAPRQMMTKIVNELSKQANIAPDFSIKISVLNGKKIAKKTWNPRLGIIGGISILGTSGIVIPYSCSAWINSIHSGIDIAIANGQNHIIGSTGDKSEQAVKKYLGLDDLAYIDMGDFVGGLLKYANKKPLKKITISGGFAKITKLSQGASDLHSARSKVDFLMLANELKKLGAGQDIIEQTKTANTANEVLEIATKNKLPLADIIAIQAKQKSKKILKNDDIQFDIIIINRSGNIIAGTD